MSLFFKQFKKPGLAQLAYLVGDTDAGVAAIIDPCRDIQEYLDAARDAGLRLTHAIETKANERPSAMSSQSLLVSYIGLHALTGLAETLE